MGVDWSLTNVLIQGGAGIAGAHAAASAAHEHKFGFLGHALVGRIAGALSGYFLQVLAVTTVTGTGDQMPAGTVEIIIVQTLTGAVAGGISMLVIGLVRHELSRSKD